MLKDEEFLSQMWQKVEIFENEEAEIEKILIRDREIRKKQCIIYLNLLLVFIGITILSLFININMFIILVLSVSTLMWSMSYEYRAMKFTVRIN